MDPDRRWLELSVRVQADDGLTALLVEVLVALGGRAVEERDGWLVTHLADPGRPEGLLADLRRTLSGLGITDPELRTDWREHEDWAETWKRGLGPRRPGTRLVVTPSWIPVEAEGDDIVLVLDPGMAFGNAEHGTTRGCLRLLERAVSPGARVLDVGSGSGILAIAAARLGAAEVLAIEGDPLATEALALNIARNGVADRVTTSQAWATPDSLAAHGVWDGVVANIESGVLRRLLPGLRAAASPDGWLILSGILEEEWPMVRTDFERAAFRLVDVDADGEWRSARFDGR